MNINEVEKQVKVNLVISCIIYILVGLCFIVSIIAIVSTPVKASTSELRTNDISNTIRNTSDCGSQSYGYFCNNSSLNDTHKEQINALQVGYLYSIKMDVSVNTWFTQSPSTIEIYNSDNSFRNISYTCNLTSTNSQNNISCNVVYVNAGKLIVNFNTGNYVPGELTIRATNSNSAYMNTGNYTISRVVQLQTINSDNSDVIDNANQNTTNIINNQNTNTNTIVDVLNDNINNTNQTIWETSENLFRELVNMCPNQIDINYVGNCILNNNNGSLVNCSSTISNRDIQHGAFYVNTTETWKGFSSNRINVVANQTYYFKFYWTSQNVNRLFYKIYFYDVNDVLFSTNGAYIDNMGNFSVSITAPNQPLHPLGYARIDVELPTAGYVYFKELQFSPKSVPFCQYGTTNGNKLDGIEGAIQGGLSDVNDTMQDVKDIQQDTYDYMTDDTNPTVNSSEINNVISNVRVQDPLNYLLTLPLNLLTKLNTLISADSCSRVSFGSLYDTELYLPCIDFEDILGSSIWNTVDVIVGIGLLVIVIKRFYDSISNILTLGKEKEVRDKLDLPTPMEFLSMILGGGR